MNKQPWETKLYVLRKKTDLLVVHCAATEEQDFGAKEIDVWHRQRGFVSIGYHYVIRRDGSVERGRPQDAQGAHAVNFNHRSVGICMMGGGAAKEKNNFLPNQFMTLEALIKAAQKDYEGLHILGHRDLPNVAKWCPSFQVSEWLLGRGISNAPRPSL